MNKIKVFKWFVVGALLCALAASPAVTQAAEEEGSLSAKSQLTSAWPMSGHDPQHSSRSEYRGPNSAVKIKWEAQQGGFAAITSLIIGTNQDIYVADSYGNLKVFDYADGSYQKQYNSSLKEKPIILNKGTVVATDGKQTVLAMQNTDLYDWRYTFDSNQSLKTSPVINEGQSVFIHAPDRRLHAISAVTGGKLWESDIYGDTTPAVGKNGVIYTLSTASIGHSEVGYLYAVAPDNGRLEWKVHLSDINMGLSAIAISDDNTIYISSNGQDRRLYAIDPEGQPKWQVSMEGSLTAPAIAKNGTIYVGSEKGLLYAFDNNGRKKWQFEANAPINVAPTIGADGTVYACAGNTIFALNPQKGDVLWQFNAQDNIVTQPIIDSKGNLYLATSNRVTALYSEAPYAPYDLTVVSDRFNNVTLTWQHESSHKEDGFIIEQKVGNQEYTQIGETVRKGTTYEISSIPSGNYCFRVKAYNKGGDSQYSNEVAIDLTSKPDNEEVRTARFYLGRTTYYKDSSAYMMDVAPIIIEERTFLPIRYVAEALDAEVEWLEEEKQVNISRDNLNVSLWIDKPWATVNGEADFIDPQNQKVSPTLVPPGRTMLPIRFIAESLDCQVEWEEHAREVKIVHVN